MKATLWKEGLEHDHETCETSLAKGKSLRTSEPRVSWLIVLTNSNLPPQKYEKGKERLLEEELGKYDLATIPRLLC